MPAVQTIAFTSTSSTFSISIGGVSHGTWDRVYEIDNPHSFSVTDNEIVIALDSGSYFSFTIYNTDTVTINGEEWAGTIRELYAELKRAVILLPVVIVYQRKTTLTDAQIKDLLNTPIEVVPAPGAGKSIMVHSAIIKLDFTAGTYTDVTDASWQLFYDNWKPASGMIFVGDALFVSEGEGIIGKIPPHELEAGAGGFAGAILTNTARSLTSTQVDNKAVSIAESGFAYAGTGYTGGHANNTVEVTVFYSIVDL
jgi:hypothetical protein